MKKKLLTLGLSSTLALGSIMPAFADTISSDANKTYIETAIGFKYPETTEDLKSKNLKATLSGAASLSIDLNLFLNDSSYSTNINGYDVTSEIIEENGKVTVIKFKINGLTATDGYKLQVEGKNYTTTVVDLSTATYSQRVNISTAANMVLGDVNKDNKVDSSDRKLLEDNLNASNTEYDLNNDGKITVSDIAIVNSNMVSTTPVETFNTEIVPSKVVENIDRDKFDVIATDENNNIEEVNGDLENLFTKEGSVSFKAKEGETNISIPLEFNDGNPQEMSIVEVKIPNGAEDASLVIECADGEIITSSSSEVATYARVSDNQEKIVVVNLGSRKPVKKITINVTPKEDGGYVEVEEVKIIGDIVNEDIVQDNTVKNFKAIAGNEEVSLSWREVPNVTGYKVYYGTDENNLNQTATTQDTNITISGLENLKTYYFAISATSGEWEGPKSSIVSATPEPEKAPNRPDFVTATGKDASIELSWKQAENAKTYNIYGKTSDDADFQNMASGITGTSYTVTRLQNNKEYTLYVTAQNDVGESAPSEYVNATPKKEIIVAPTLPTKNRIPNTNITNVQMGHPHNYNPNLYPDGFDPNWLIDEDYYTHWVAREWWETNNFTFTFDAPKTMDYLIWVPRLDGSYRKSFLSYNITVWYEGDDLNGPGKEIAKDKRITTRAEDDKYFVFDFPKQENVKQIRIKPTQWDGSPTNMNASEVVFYEYNNIADRVSELFANGSRTELKKGISEQQINDLKAEISDLDGFVIDRDILLKELDIAESLLAGNKDNLGLIKDNVYSMNSQNDVKSINNWQPLGLVGLAGEKLTIFADIPEGETVQLVPTQFFEEATKLSASPITLKNGRNVITVPKIGNVNNDRGGSLYITYSGNNPSAVKLQVLGGYKIPYLELRDFYSIDKETAKQRIDAFITELIAYKPYDLPGNKEIQNRNQAEISLPNVLLSLPATKVLDGINQGATSQEAKVEKMYQNVLAWEEVMNVVYKTYGIDKEKTTILETRHNIRYMKMFGNAFMYAAGNHIGIGYNSVAPLMNGTPVNEQTTTENNLFGWGIGHEIGHVMDIFGKAEVTNNIYSLMLQTYDGKQNTLPSRLEGGSYEKAFKKVSVGGEGVPNDVFTHLVMYWQLHLAYDNGDNPFNFYNELHKLYREDATLNSFKDMDKFAVASSKVVNKDLTEFFTRWGVSLSQQAKDQMATQPKEDRAIYYLSDQSRRVRLANTFAGNKAIDVTATASLQNSQSSQNNKAKEVVINISNSSESAENMQGYEILRKGAGDKEFKSIGFTTTNTYTDYIGSANNLTFTYAVKPVDILGNVSPQKETGQVRISYDNTIETSLYNIDTETGIVTFNEATIVTGIKVTPKAEGTEMPTGKYKVYADIVDSVSPASTTTEEGFVLAKDGDFSNNYSNSPNTYISYFNKPGSTEDKIWAYDVNRLKLENFNFDNYNVEFLSYPGDNVEFMEMGIGRLSADYRYGEGEDEVIAKDSLVIVGKYRGNSVLSNIYIKGKYARENSLTEKPTIEERLVGGYTLMFDTLDTDGTITSSTAEGIFIFVPELQKDDQGEHPEKLSQLPTEIMAEMWQGSFGEDGSFNKERLTSDTTWINMPTDESLPTIVLQGGKDSLNVEFK